MTSREMLGLMVGTMPEKSDVILGMIHCIIVSLPGRQEAPFFASLLSIVGPSIILVGSGPPLEPFPKAP